MSPHRHEPASTKQEPERESGASKAASQGLGRIAADFGVEFVLRPVPCGTHHRNSPPEFAHLMLEPISGVPRGLPGGNRLRRKWRRSAELRGRGRKNEGNSDRCQPTESDRQGRSVSEANRSPQRQAQGPPRRRRNTLVTLPLARRTGTAGRTAGDLLSFAVNCRLVTISRRSLRLGRARRRFDRSGHDDESNRNVASGAHDRC